MARVRVLSLKPSWELLAHCRANSFGPIKTHAIAYLGQRTEFDQFFPLRVRDLIVMEVARCSLWSMQLAHSDELLDAAKRVDLEDLERANAYSLGRSVTTRTFCPRHYARRTFRGPG